MKRNKPLARKTPIKRSLIPLKRSRIARMSSRRKREATIYSNKRASFLAANPWCVCAELLFGKPARATDVHHFKGRTGRNYLDETTWMAVSREAHQWIHNNPGDARKRGWLA